MVYSDRYPVEEAGRDHDFDWAIVEPHLIVPLFNWPTGEASPFQDPNIECSIVAIQFGTNRVGQKARLLFLGNARL